MMSTQELMKDIKELEGSGFGDQMYRQVALMVVEAEAIRTDPLNQIPIVGGLVAAFRRFSLKGVVDKAKEERVRGIFNEIRKGNATIREVALRMAAY